MEFKEVVDQYYEMIIELGGMSLPSESIPKQMMDFDRTSNFEGISYWKRIDSTITNNEVLELEKFFSAKLPRQLKEFVQDKFYLDLEFGDHAFRVFKLTPDLKLEHWKNEILENYENLYSKGYLIFGETDSAVLCLDTKEVQDPEKFEVGLIDIYSDEYLKLANNFNEFTDQLNTWLSDWKNSKINYRT